MRVCEIMGNNVSAPTCYLEICPDEDAKYYYEKHGQYYDGDSGLDLFVPNRVYIGGKSSVRINLKVRCQMYVLKNGLWHRFVRFAKKETPESHKMYVGYKLVPRSSVSKTPLMMHNSFGVIDAEYTGVLSAPFLNYLRDANDHGYMVEAGTRLVQIIGPQQNPLKVIMVDKLRNTTRGEGGFGSTDSLHKVPAGSSQTPLPVAYNFAETQTYKNADDSVAGPLLKSAGYNQDAKLENRAALDVNDNVQMNHSDRKKGVSVEIVFPDKASEGTGGRVESDLSSMKKARYADDVASRGSQTLTPRISNKPPPAF